MAAVSSSSKEAPDTKMVDRSPSPPLAAPPQSTFQPGPRAQKLTAVFNEALTHTIRTCSYAHFASCFPTPARHNQVLLESVHRQIVNMVETRSRKEFEDILIERDVVQGLGELEKLMHEAEERKARNTTTMDHDVPPHMLPPTELYCAHLSPYLVKAQHQLEEELKSLQEENGKLALQIEAQRDQVGTIVDGLENAVRQIEQANKAMISSLGVTDLQRVEDTKPPNTPGRVTSRNLRYQP